jgi:aspartate carbamoyltransferase catalytic subunit
LFFVAPEEVQIGDDILRYLEEQNVRFHLTTDVRLIADQADVIYQTRIEKERLHGKSVDSSRFNIDSNVLTMLKSGAIIMHPLPRSVEISPEVDRDPRAAYFRQAKNGLYVRMALLKMLFDEKESQ